ncbi:pimeloyl-ACP methyl ester carboxylesterase [Microbacterium sp. BK668]|nr:pimeloyl-ACP methyl ester carboxylesterase [Microbacterium sp. BK668]
MPVVPGFTHRYVDLPGLTAHVAEIGEGEPVVMLHGLPQHWWQWRSIGAALGARYRVICPDLRGFGWTRAESPRIGHLTIMQDAVALMDALDIRSARFVAHDMGGLPACHLAYAHPDRMRALVVLSVPPPFMRMSLGLLPALRHVPQLRFHRRGRSLAYLFRPPYTSRPMSPETVATYLAPMARPEIDGAISQLYRGLVGGELPRLAGGFYRTERLRVPSLYLFGEKDEPLTESFARRHSGDVARYADHFETATVPGAAHFMTDDEPDEVTRLIADFFKRIG